MKLECPGCGKKLKHTELVKDNFYSDETICPGEDCGHSITFGDIVFQWAEQHYPKDINKLLKIIKEAGFN